MTDSAVREPDEPSAASGQSAVVLGVGVITALVAILALSTLGDRSLHIDEALTVSVATAPAHRFIEDLAHNGANMSLYLGLMRAWLTFGDSEWWLRLPSVIFAALSVPVFFVLARRFVTHRGALVAAALFALSPPFLRHAQIGRAYSLTVLLVLLSWLAMTSYIEDRGRRWWYVLAAVAVIYSNVIGSLVVGAQLVWLFSARRREALVTGLWIAVLSAPQLAFTLGPQAHGPTWIQPTSVAQLEGVLRYLTGTTTVRSALVVVGLWLAGAIVAFRRGNHLSSAPGAWLFLPVAGLLLISEITPMILGRYLLMVLPAAILLVAILFDAAPRAGIVAVALIGSLTFSTVGSTLNRSAPDWDAATRSVLERASPSDGMLLLNSRQLVEYYWDQQGRPAGTPQLLNGDWGPIRRTYETDVAAASARLRHLDDIWVVQRRSPGTVPADQRALLDEIERRRHVADRWTRDGGAITVTRYEG